VRGATMWSFYSSQEPLGGLSNCHYARRTHWTVSWTPQQWWSKVVSS